MGASYRLFGLETSPFSTKVRSYLRYKKLPFDWVPKTFGRDEEFRTLSKSDALPMLVSPNGGISHDTSLILNRIESTRNQPTATPDDAACRLIASLLEAYADEWLNKAMFHYRWSGTAAAKASAKRQVECIFDGFEVEDRAGIEKSVAKSMTGRLKVIGLNKKNGQLVEKSFQRFLTLLNAHLEHHLFLFGGHPSLADFALAGQLIQLMMDDEPATLIRETAPFVSAWCEFMEDPRPGAPFETFEQVSETLLPLIRDEVAETYVAWSLANDASIAAKRKTVTVEIDGEEYKQSVQHHSARNFANLKTVFAEAQNAEAVESFLDDAGLGEVFDVGTKTPQQAETSEESVSEETSSDSPEAEGENEKKSSSRSRSSSRRRNRKPRKPKTDNGSDQAERSVV